MRRIDAEERRARLGCRHRLARERAPRIHSRRCARSSSSTRPTRPRCSSPPGRGRTGSTSATSSTALRGGRSLVRMLGMRRTLWVVPRELVPVVDAACTRTVAVGSGAARGVRRRSGCRRRPRTVARSGRGDRPRGARGPRRGVHVGAHARRPAPRDEAPARGRHPLGDRGERGVARPSAARGRGEARARPAARRLDARPVPLGARGGERRRPRHGDRTGGAPPPLARGVRAGDGDRHPLVDGLDGA